MRGWSGDGKVQVVQVVRVLGGVLGGVLGATLLLAACGSGQPPARSAAPPPSYASPSAPSPAAPPAGSPAPSAAAAPSPSGSGATLPSPPAAASPSTGSSTAAGELTGTLLSPQQAADQAGVDPAGVVAGLSFRDANGLNTVVLREAETRTGVGLLAEHLVDDDAASRRVLREVRDDVSDCDVDVTAEFLAESLAVHDDDGDGTGEVVFAYRLACRGDVSSAEQKLLVLEDGDKHILRGYTSTPYEPYQDPTPEPAAERWPAGAYDRALASFRELAPEF